jgi:hypothetical protein
VLDLVRADQLGADRDLDRVADHGELGLPHERVDAHLLRLWRALDVSAPLRGEMSGQIGIGDCRALHRATGPACRLPSGGVGHGQGNRMLS